MKNYLSEANNYIKNNKHLVDNTYRHKFHLMGEIGWINDPNGFSIFRDEYHLFYQFHPFSSKWGPMYWGHAKSKDLINWEYLPVALAPLEGGVEGGTAFSGSAIEYCNEHVLLYTENWPKRQVQSIAKSIDGINYERIKNNPVITGNLLPNESSHVDFRDPKVWAMNNEFYSLISSRHSDSSGQLLLFKSTDFENWDYINVISKSDNKIGKMWECPDLFRLDERDVLLVSPQYMDTKGNAYNNVHSSIYMVGMFDHETNKYNYSNYNELDSGLDFYAPQTILDKKGRRIMIAWMAMWERNMPTDDLNHKWAGSMTFPRILELKEGRLIQNPIDELLDYRTTYMNFDNDVDGEVDTMFDSDVCDIEVIVNNINASEFGMKLFKGQNEETILNYNVEESILTFDRSKSGYEIVGNKQYEPSSNRRSLEVKLLDNRLKLRILLDKSSIEVFIQDGLNTMTALVYPKNNSKGISVYSKNGTVNFNVKKWNIKR